MVQVFKRYSLMLVMVVLSVGLTGQLSAAPRDKTLLSGPWMLQKATLTQLQHAVPITHWQWRYSSLGTGEPPAHWTAKAARGTLPWVANYAIGKQDLFHGKQGYAWFKATLPQLPAGLHMLEFQGVSTRATVYLNGTMLTDHRGGAFWFQVPLNSAWNSHGTNTLRILVHMTHPGDKQATLKPVVLGNAAIADFPPAAFAAVGAGGSAHWQSVLVPNDFVVNGKFNRRANGSHGYLPVYPVWYKRTFTVPVSDKNRSLELYFGGVLSDAVVYVNGIQVGEHADGYSPFQCDIASAVHFGAANSLVVYVDPRATEGWWYEGGGIYRNVWLMAKHRLHIAHWGAFVMATVPGRIRYGGNGDRADAGLVIQTTLVNQHKQPRSVDLVSTIIAPTGKVVATVRTPETIAGLSRATFNQTATVYRAKLWSLHHCNLYSLHTSLKAGAHLADAKTTSFGIRTIRYSARSGFYLNGRHVELDGTCNHQDFPAVGVGAPADLWWWRVARLKAIGSNAYRCSHNAMNTALYKACDHLGMLVMDENREIGDTREGGDYRSAKSYVGVPYGQNRNLQTLILRDRNHPSVIMWSLANEEMYIQATPFGAKLFRHMMKIVRKLDPTRPITSAMNGGYPKGFATVEDLLGINYAPGNYIKMHRQFPHFPIFGSEVGSSESDRGVMKNNAKAGLVGQYTMHSPWSQVPWNTWPLIGTQPFVAGGFVWTGFDYRGEPTPYQWPDTNSHFGLLDICGFPKPDAYYYKACWTRKPMVYIQPQWDFPDKPVGTPVTVRCFSNCSRVELFVNGKSLGAKDMPKFKYVDWNVPWHPGRLTVKGYSGTAVVATFHVQTPGAPARIKLFNEWPHILADGLSIAPIGVEVMDAHGHVVDSSADRITFAVSGPADIAGTSNGDPASQIPNAADYSNAFYGKCMVLVRATNTAGSVTVTARSPGLPAATLEFQTQPVK